MAHLLPRNVLALLIVATLLSACAPAIARDTIPAIDQATLLLDHDTTLGQTFVSNHAGLAAVEVFLAPAAPGDGVVQLRLYPAPDALEPLATAPLPLAAITGPEYYRFAFTPLQDSHGASYYVELSLDGTGSLIAGSAPGGAYLDGALYANGQPRDAQLSFRLIFALPLLLLGFLGQLAGWLPLLLAAIWLYLLPGWALLVLLWPASGRLAWGEQLGVAAGVSLALLPLLLLAGDLAGLRAGPVYAWLPGTLALAVLLWQVRRQLVGRSFEAVALVASGGVTSDTTARALPTLRAWRRSQTFWPDVTLAGVLALLLFSRLQVIGPLAAPMWGDAYQHALIAQLIVDQAGLFESWLPYAPYEGLTVQYGFPAVVAAYMWLTGADVAEATLVVGQLVNALAVIGLYALALRLTGGNRWAGVGAVLIAGLLSPLPAFYLNWGRYAQLSGQAVLPAALWLTIEALRARAWPWRQALLAGLCLAGMVLHYYRMPFYYATFVAAWLAGYGLPAWRGNWRRWLVVARDLLRIGLFSLVLFAPWAARVAGGSIAAKVERGVTSGSALAGVLTDYRQWTLLNEYLPWPLTILALAGLVLSLLRRRWAVASLGLWTLALALLVAGRLVRLPGANLMQNFAVLIALYLPASLLIGFVIAEVAALLRRRGAAPAIAALLVLAALAGTPQQLSVVDPGFALVTRPDMRAMAWMREHVPADAHVLVEGFRIYRGTSIVGADAGWWIPLLAGRSTTMPPQYALLNERPADPTYNQRMIDLVAHLETATLDSPEGIRVACDYGITHAFVGQGQGLVGLNVTQLFSIDELAASPAFEQLYRRDRVALFALKPAACEAAR